MVKTTSGARLLISVVSIVVLCVSLLVSKYGILQPPESVPSNRILLARYLLNRWPETWDEVEDAVWKFNSTVPRHQFRTLKIDVIDSTRAEVTVTGRNLIGWPFKQTFGVMYTSDWEERFKRDEEELRKGSRK